MTSAFFSGLTMSLGLIVAIGAQNAFFLRQGLRNEHVFAVCLTCALSDAVLVTLGVAGFGRLTGQFPWPEPVMRYGGAAFLLWYAARSLRSALRSDAALTVKDAPPATLRQVLLACLAITWLNPHVYLDTVVLLGSVSTQFAGNRPVFAAAAILASVTFFFALGYGARLLRPVFARPGTWRLVDGSIAVVMVFIAAGLLRGA